MHIALSCNFKVKNIANTAWVRAQLCKLQKKGCTRLESGVKHQKSIDQSKKQLPYYLKRVYSNIVPI